MADYLTTTSELNSIADAIRTKGGTTAFLTYPTGFVSAINNIEINPVINNIEINPVMLNVSKATVSKISGTMDDYLMTMT